MAMSDQVRRAGDAFFIASVIYWRRPSLGASVLYHYRPAVWASPFRRRPSVGGMGSNPQLKNSASPSVCHQVLPPVLAISILSAGMSQPICLPAALMPSPRCPLWQRPLHPGDRSHMPAPEKAIRLSRIFRPGSDGTLALLFALTSL